MKDLTLSPTNDVQLSVNIRGLRDLSITSGTPALAQSIGMRLRTWLGESVYNRGAGVPWTQVVFERGTPLTAVRAVILDAVLETPLVTGATLDVSLDASSRTLTGSGVATTVDGDEIPFDIAQG